MYTMLRKYRREWGIKQSELARMVGVTHSCVAKWELNIWTMSVDVASRLAEIFMVEVKDLILVDSDFKSIGNLLDKDMVHKKTIDRCY